MPEIMYFAPPASLTEMREVPVLTEGNNERDKVGVDELQDQKVRGEQHDELWVTPDTRTALRRLRGKPHHVIAAAVQQVSSCALHVRCSACTRAYGLRRGARAGVPPTLIPGC